MSLSSPLDGRALYYLETDQIDFDLFHQMPWRKAVWSMLATTQPADFAGLLSAEEITRWRDRTLNWFEKLKIEPGIVPVHITYSDVQVFINQAAGETLKIFKMWRNM